MREAMEDRHGGRRRHPENARTAPLRLHHGLRYAVAPRARSLAGLALPLGAMGPKVAAGSDDQKHSPLLFEWRGRRSDGLDLSD